MNVDFFMVFEENDRVGRVIRSDLLKDDNQSKVRVRGRHGHVKCYIKTLIREFSHAFVPNTDPVACADRTRGHTEDLESIQLTIHREANSLSCNYSSFDRQICDLILN